jgi:hypothetical protein
MSFVRKATLAAAISFGLAIASPAVYAQFGGIKVPGLGGGSSSSQSNVDVDGLLNQQNGLMKRFNGALNNMLAAEARTLRALGYKTEADKADAEARYYESGNVMDKGQIERSVAVSEENKKLIDQKAVEGGVMTAEGKKELAAAVPHYVRGMTEGAQLPPEFSKWASSLQSGVSSLSGNPTQAMKLKDGAAPGMYVAQNVPNLVSKWGQTTKNFMAFAKKNDVDVGSLDGVASKF